MEWDKYRTKYYDSQGRRRPARLSDVTFTPIGKVLKGPAKKKVNPKRKRNIGGAKRSTGVKTTTPKKKPVRRIPVPKKRPKRK